ncbi:unnamed protein product [Chrysoparadoxa australica]
MEQKPCWRVVTGKLHRAAPVFYEATKVLLVPCSRVVKCLDYISGEERGRLVGHTGDVTAIAVLSSGNVLTGGQDGFLHEWEMIHSSDSDSAIPVRTCFIGLPVQSLHLGIGKGGTEEVFVATPRGKTWLNKVAASSSAEGAGGSTPTKTKGGAGKSSKKEKRRLQREKARDESRQQRAKDLGITMEEVIARSKAADVLAQEKHAERQERKAAMRAETLQLALEGKLHLNQSLPGWQLLWLDLRCNDGEGGLLSVVSEVTESGTSSTKSSSSAVKMRCTSCVLGGGEGGVLWAVMGNRKRVHFTEVNGRGRKWTLKLNKVVTSLTASPAVGKRQSMLVTGHGDGEICLWHDIGCHAEGKAKHQAPVCTSMHWHSHRVLTMQLSVDERFLLSGGEEGVLVQWNISTGSKTFLPRLGGPVAGIAASTGGHLVAVSSFSNSLRMVSLVNWQVPWRIEGLTFPSFDTAEYTSKMKLWVEPASGCVAVNGRPGHMQLYDPSDESVRSSIEVVPYNRISRLEKRPMQPPLVQFAAFSSAGASAGATTGAATHMVTVQGREDTSWSKGMLKFWTMDKASGSYKVNAVLDSPHTGPITSLTYHPKQDQVVTTAGTEEAAVKIWTLLPSGKGANAGWACTLTLHYKVGRTAHSSAFSGDGSLLAVGFATATSTTTAARTDSAPAVVTLWNPEAAALVAVVMSPDQGQRLTCPTFLPGCPHLAACTNEGAVIWDLLTCSTVWNLRGDVVCMAAVDSPAALQSGKQGITVGGGCGGVAVCVSMAGGNGKGKDEGGCAVLLFESSGSRSNCSTSNAACKPLFKWRLKGEVITTLVFLLGKDEGLLGLTRNKELVLLTPEDPQAELQHGVSTVLGGFNTTQGLSMTSHLPVGGRKRKASTSSRGVKKVMVSNSSALLLAPTFTLTLHLISILWTLHHHSSSLALIAMWPRASA